VTYPLEVHDFFCPRGDFVAGGSCGLVQIYDAVPYVLGCGSFAGFVPVLRVGCAFRFGEQFPLGFPWRGCSRQVLVLLEV
jgi:hypothetical protein